MRGLRAALPAVAALTGPLCHGAGVQSDTWCGSTALIDLEDPRLRIRAAALTQLCRTERDKALAVYLFVKRLPFSKSLKLCHRTAREVLDRGRGDAEDKACLMVALLRAAGVPARLRYGELDAALLRGLTGLKVAVRRPAVQALIAGRWSTTDTFIFDAGYIAAAKARMQQLNWELGFGLHRTAQLLWDGAADAYLAGGAHARALCLGVFDDPQAFADSQPFGNALQGLGRGLRRGWMAMCIQRRVRQLRALARPGGGD